ncbi:MAG: hypothetical protein ACI4D0_09295 [Lachnospira sp.]
MKDKKDYKTTLSQIYQSLNFVKEVDNDTEMDKEYIDIYTTHEQRLRDKKITELLCQYVDAYSYKNTSNKFYKAILFSVCLILLLGFCAGFVMFAVTMIEWGTETSVEGAVKVLTVCVTFITLIVGTMNIITKYVFPENEEEYITRIVEIIQNNDLENKKENIRVRSQSFQDDMKDNS